jgi:integrase
MKSACAQIGLSESNMSPHALRHGGATMLALKGFPRYLIERMGGWKPGSTTLDQYVHVHLTDNTRVEISRAMSQGSSSEVRTMEEVLSEIVKETNGTR